MALPAYILWEHTMHTPEMALTNGVDENIGCTMLTSPLYAADNPTVFKKIE